MLLQKLRTILILSVSIIFVFQIHNKSEQYRAFTVRHNDRNKTEIDLAENLPNVDCSFVVSPIINNNTDWLWQVENGHIIYSNDYHGIFVPSFQ